MSSTRKKVIIRRLTGDTLAGYLPSFGFVRTRLPELTLDFLDLSGRIVEIALKDIKTISFVRDFNLADTINPERITRRTFLSRPRNEGLWVRITFRSPDRLPDRSPDLLEGLAATDISLLDALIEDSGLSISPPDIRSNTQRIFVPRSAMASLEILAVITSPSRKPAPIQTADQLRKELQESLFDAPTPPNTRPN